MNYETADQVQSASTALTILGVLAFLGAVVLGLSIHAAVNTQGFRFGNQIARDNCHILFHAGWDQSF
jgi:hypothetical protein